MNAVLKVTPERLVEAAEQFGLIENNIRNITQEMVNIVDGFKSIWQGEAATGFTNRFNSLSDDLERMFGMIREHATDLTEMANEYRLAEEESIQQANILATEAIS